MKPFRTEVENDLAEIPRLAGQVDEFMEQAGLPAKLAFELNLCLEELLVNTISYGFGDGEEHRITVTIACSEDRLRCEIEDDGSPFDPGSRTGTADLDSSLEERPVGGLGIHIVHTLMDDVQYRRSQGRNHLKLLKSLSNPK